MIKKTLVLKKTLKIIALMVMLVIFGCGPKYIYNNETFTSASDALQKQKEFHSHVLQEIKPTGNPVHGAILILIPSNAEIQKNYIRLGNEASRLNKEQMDYLISAQNNNYQLIIDSINKSGIFDSVSIDRHNGNPASYPISNYDFIFFVDVDGSFIRGKDNSRPLPISFDKNIPLGTPRVIAMLDSLSRQANAVRGK